LRFTADGETTPIEKDRPRRVATAALIERAARAGGTIWMAVETGIGGRECIGRAAGDAFPVERELVGSAC